MPPSSILSPHRKQGLPGFVSPPPDLRGSSGHRRELKLGNRPLTLHCSGLLAGSGTAEDEPGSPCGNGGGPTHSPAHQRPRPSLSLSLQHGTDMGAGKDRGHQDVWVLPTLGPGCDFPGPLPTRVPISWALGPLLWATSPPSVHGNPQEPPPLSPGHRAQQCVHPALQGSRV